MPVALYNGFWLFDLRFFFLASVLTLKGEKRFRSSESSREMLPRGSSNKGTIMRGNQSNLLPEGTIFAIKADSECLEKNNCGSSSRLLRSALVRVAKNSFLQGIHFYKFLSLQSEFIGIDCDFSWLISWMTFDFVPPWKIPAQRSEFYSQRAKIQPFGAKKSNDDQPTANPRRSSKADRKASTSEKFTTYGCCGEAIRLNAPLLTLGSSLPGNAKKRRRRYNQRD